MIRLSKSTYGYLILITATRAIFQKSIAIFPALFFASQKYDFSAIQQNNSIRLNVGNGIIITNQGGYNILKVLCQGRDRVRFAMYYPEDDIEKLVDGISRIMKLN